MALQLEVDGGNLSNPSNHWTTQANSQMLVGCQP